MPTASDITAPVPTGAWRSSPGGAIPMRRTLSLRRTSSLDMHWPDGREGLTRIVGRARDIETCADGTIELLDEAEIHSTARITRELVSAAALPPDPRLANLGGIRAGGELRSWLRAAYPTQAERDTAQYLLLDDLAGATLVSSWGWFAWDGYSRELADRIHTQGIGGKRGDMRGVCIGFASGSSSLNAQGRPHLDGQTSAIVPTLIDPADPQGWHPFFEGEGPRSRRARWIDLWREDSEILIATGFQDSAARQDGLRQAIHEYRAAARIDAASGRVIKLEATPYVLPHRECPAAVANIQRLVGEEITALREIVPQMLARELGCTHLNDVLRALSAVPFLTAKLRQLQDGDHR